MRQDPSVNNIKFKMMKNRKMLYFSVLAFIVVVIFNTHQSLAHNLNNNNNHHHHHQHHEEYKYDSTNKNFISLVLPHDTYPGYSIKKFSANFSSPNSPFSSMSTYSSKPFNYRLLETGYSKYFTVLDDGMVMTTSDLTPLVNRPVRLVVLEETPNSTTTHQLQLYIMNRKDMLRFPTAVIETAGEVSENMKRGTHIEGVPLLQANSDRGRVAIVYSIADGNAGNLFALQDSITREIAQKIKIMNSKKGGVYLVTNKPLDRETQKEHKLVIEAADEKGINKAEAKIVVNVVDENDNRPVFTQKEYKFTVAGIKTTDVHGNETTTWKRFTSVGKVEAKDADDDKIAYKLVTPNNFVVIVPQTGELLLASEPIKSELLIEVEAHDLRPSPLESLKPVKVLIEFVEPDPLPVLMQHMSHDEINQHSHRRDKRRVTRAVRPTKRIDFTEADGDTEGRNVFQLEKETDKETFKIRDENPWVTVETNGAVRVKKKWDYEELGPEKTIDFWVIITNQGHNGKS